MSFGPGGREFSSPWKDKARCRTFDPRGTPARKRVCMWGEGMARARARAGPARPDSNARGAARACA
eukprot:10340579-Lingulodinium_polyedra.AAC.1